MVYCPVCNAEKDAARVYTTHSPFFAESFSLYDCPVCHTQITMPQLTPSQLLSYYANEVEVGANKYGKWIKKYRYQYRFIFSVLGESRKKVLEIGCNTGNLLRFLNEKGHDTYGIELSKNASEYGSKVNGAKISQTPIEAYKEAEFDLIIMVHTFEHIHRPNEFLHECRQHLAAGGYLFIEVPNASSKAHEITGERGNIQCVPFHSYLYSLHSLETILKNNGFEVIKRRKYSAKEDYNIVSRAIVDDIQWRLNEIVRTNVISKPIGALAKACIRFYPVRKTLGWWYGMQGKGESIAIIAQKQGD